MEHSRHAKISTMEINIVLANTFFTNMRNLTIFLCSVLMNSLVPILLGGDTGKNIQL